MTESLVRAIGNDESPSKGRYIDFRTKGDVFRRGALPFAGQRAGCGESLIAIRRDAANALNRSGRVRILRDFIVNVGRRNAAVARPFSEDGIISLESGRACNCRCCNVLGRKRDSDRAGPTTAQHDWHQPAHADLHSPRTPRLLLPTVCPDDLQIGFQTRRLRQYIPARLPGNREWSETGRVISIKVENWKQRS